MRWVEAQNSEPHKDALITYPKTEIACFTVVAYNALPVSVIPLLFSYDADIYIGCINSTLVDCFYHCIKYKLPVICPWHCITAKTLLGFSVCTFILRFTYFCCDTLLDVGNWILTSSQPQRVVSGPDHLLDARKECRDNFVGVALRLTIIEPAARYSGRRN